MPRTLTEGTRSTRAWLLGVLTVAAIVCLVAPSAHDRVEGTASELTMRIENYYLEEGEETSYFYCAATVTNTTAVSCEHEFVLIGIDESSEVVFREPVGAIKLERLESLEIEITSDIPIIISRRIHQIKFMTQSQCDIYYSTGKKSESESRFDLRRRVRKIYEEQRSLWKKKYELQHSLKLAKEAGDKEQERFLTGKLREIEQEIDENDATRRRLSGT